MSRWPCTRRRAVGTVFDLDIISDSAAGVVLRAKGKGARSLFEPEAGGHRWQRIPPNERRGKTHSSTVTVAVLSETAGPSFVLRESDCEFSTFRGSGPGGQLRNKLETAVRVVHRPTGVAVRCETERSQLQNRANALRLLESRLRDEHNRRITAARNGTRREQVGSGERSDKIRTVQEQNGVVVNNETGRKIPLPRYLKGDIVAIQ